MLCGETCLQADQTFVADRQLALEGTAQAHVQVVQALRLLAQAFAGMAQAAGDAFQAQAFAQQLVAHAQHQAPAQAVETLLQVAGVGRQQFGGGRRRRRAHVGDEVADRYVGLVADRADDWRGAGRHGARHRFFVEAPEVFQGTAATGQDQRVEALPVGQLQRADDLCDGLAALHCGGHQGQLDLRCAAAKHADDVADHRPAGRTDDTDAARMGGQRTLAFAGEQAFAGEFFLQCLEGQAQGAVAGRLDGIGDQLVVAASLEQRDLPAHLYRQPVAQGLAYAQGVLPEQRAADLRVAVLEGEVDMAGGRPGEVGQLALDPDLREHVFQQQAGALVQLADGQHLAIEAEPLEGIVTHGRHDKAAHRDVRSILGFVRQILQEIFDEAFHQGAIVASPGQRHLAVCLGLGQRHEAHGGRCDGAHRGGHQGDAEAGLD